MSGTCPTIFIPANCAPNVHREFRDRIDARRGNRRIQLDPGKELRELISALGEPTRFSDGAPLVLLYVLPRPRPPRNLLKKNPLSCTITVVGSADRYERVRGVWQRENPLFYVRHVDPRSAPPFFGRAKAFLRVGEGAKHGGGMEDNPFPTMTKQTR